MDKWKKNELEMSVLAAQKALQKLVDENPKSGIVLYKGEDIESRIRNKQALEAMDKIMSFFGIKGASSWGICGSCTHFNQKGISSVANSFGKCKLKSGEIVHCYNSCKQHSEEGGGYAKV